MFRFCLALSLLLVMPIAQAAPPQKKPTTKPTLEAITATQGILSNRLLKGHTYKLHQAPGLTVEQSTGDGVLVRFSNGYSPWGEIPSILLLKTDKQYADSSFISQNLCARYNGLYQYVNVMGAARTIHSFSEVSCTNYALPQAWVDQARAKEIEEARQRFERDALNPYLTQVAQTISQRWNPYYLDLDNSDYQIIITTVITPDGQTYNTKLEASSEGDGSVIRMPGKVSNVAYQEQLKAYYHQNHLVADGNALRAIEGGGLPPLPADWKIRGLQVRFKLWTNKSTVGIDYLAPYTGELDALHKTSTPFVPITMPNRPVEPLSPEAQAAVNRAKQLQQQQFWKW